MDDVLGAPGPAGLTLELLGGFSIHDGGEPFAVPRSAQRLLAFLALVPGPHAREQVTAALWPAVGDDRAKGNLRSVVWRLGRSGAPQLLRPGCALRLADGVAVDLARARALAEGVLAGGREAPAAGQLRLLHLDVLPAWDEEWARPEVERWRQVRLHALEALSVRLSRSERYGEAIATALAAVAADPLRESAQRALIAAYLAEGNESEALRQYRACHRVFVDVLGMRPSRRLDALIEPALVPR